MIGVALVMRISNDRWTSTPEYSYLARHLTHASLADVGRAFGGRDHTTVLHGVDKIHALMQGDAKLRKAIDGLIQGIPV